MCDKVYIYNVDCVTPLSDVVAYEITYAKDTQMCPSL